MTQNLTLKSWIYFELLNIEIQAHLQFSKYLVIHKIKYKITLQCHVLPAFITFIPFITRCVIYTTETLL